MKTLIIIISLICLQRSFGLNSINQEVKKYLSKHYVTSEIDNLLDKHSTPLNNYYQFEPIDNENYHINWGNNQLHKISSSNYPAIYGIRQSLVWENSEFIILKGWTGSDSWQYIVLPLNQSGKEYIVFNPVGENSKLNVLVTEYGCRKDTLLKVVILSSKKVYPIIDNSIKCSSAMTHYCIDSIEILEKEIIVHWIIPNNIDKPNKVITKRYKYNAS